MKSVRADKDGDFYKSGRYKVYTVAWIEFDNGSGIPHDGNLNISNLSRCQLLGDVAILHLFVFVHSIKCSIHLVFPITPCHDDPFTKTHKI